jgi:hypothetical protein
LSDDDAEVSEMARASLELMEEIRPLLAGKGAEVQSSALADMTAMWLSGMFLTDPRTGEISRRATDEMREVAFRMFIKVVRELVPINEEMFTKPMLDKQKGKTH